MGCVDVVVVVLSVDVVVDEVVWDINTTFILAYPVLDMFPVDVPLPPSYFVHRPGLMQILTGPDSAFTVTVVFRGQDIFTE